MPKKITKAATTKKGGSKKTTKTKTVQKAGKNKHKGGGWGDPYKFKK